ncbi:hypothetical protein GLOIN_2v1782447 [Rhizophagus clarus]|uniref:HTH myb-type domain-containing protein n=1 Tax=Rhizophagus clarus TaxID=94130 RepID=A0A8H3MF74_9GLOM|nr:hypothetical protein GLOIN_2v1782447 [Rhizophagus clarus]
MRKSKFNEKADGIILNHTENNSICYAEIRKKIPEYTTKQIRQRWKNQLDPALCHDRLDESEETLIIELVKNNQGPNGKIHWINLIPIVKAMTGKSRSENKLKNFWYSKRGQLLSKNYKPSRDDDGVQEISRLDILCQETLKYDFLR